MGLFGAKDMSGYWPAGRGAIIPQLTPPKELFVPPVYSFKIDHLSSLLRRMNKNDAKIYEGFFGFTLVKVSISRFSNRK